MERGGHFAVHGGDALVEALEKADLRIVALEDALGLKEFNEEFDEQALVPFGPLAQGLDGEIVAVAIDDQRWQPVALTVSQPVSVGILDHDAAIGCRALEAFAKEGAVGRNVLAREQANGNLRFVTIKSAAEKAVTLVGDAHDGARLGRGATHIAAIHPKVAGANTVHAARANRDRRLGQPSSPLESTHCPHTSKLLRRTPQRWTVIAY